LLIRTNHLLIHTAYHTRWIDSCSSKYSAAGVYFPL